MMYELLADLVVLFHAGFVLFVVFGGFAAVRWERVVWLHMPAVIWGVTIEYTGGICPLTPLENALRARAGTAGYSGGFIDHYLLGWLYPRGLTPHIQYALGALVLGVNVVAYRIVIARHRRRAHARQ